MNTLLNVHLKIKKKYLYMTGIFFFSLYFRCNPHVQNNIMCFVCAKNNPPAKRPHTRLDLNRRPLHVVFYLFFSVRTKRFKKRHVGIIVQSVSNVVNTFACKNSSSQPEQPIPHIVCRYLFK